MVHLLLYIAREQVCHPLETLRYSVAESDYPFNKEEFIVPTLLSKLNRSLQLIYLILRRVPILGGNSFPQRHAFKAL